MASGAVVSPPSTPDEPASPSPRRSSSFRLGGASVESNPVAVLRESEIAKLKAHATTLESKLLKTKEDLAAAKREEAAYARRVARTVEAAERNFASERRSLTRAAARADVALLELAESEARRGLETGMLVDLAVVVEDATAGAMAIAEIQAATKPLRAKLNALTFQLRVTKVVELKNQQKRLAEAVQKTTELEVALSRAKEAEEALQARIDMKDSTNGRDGDATAPLATALAIAEQRAAAAEKQAAELQQHLREIEQRLEAELPKAENVTKAAQIQVEELQQRLRAQEVRAATAEQVAAAAEDRAEVRAIEAAQALEGRTAYLERTQSEARLAASTETETQLRKSREEANLRETALRREADRLVEALTAAERAQYTTEHREHQLSSAIALFVKVLLSDDGAQDDVDHALQALWSASTVTHSGAGGDAVSDGDATPGRLIRSLRRKLDVTGSEERALDVQRQLAATQARLVELSASGARVAGDRVHALEQQLALLETAHHRLEAEAESRLHTANDLMARIDQLRGERDEVESEHREQCEALRAAAAAANEEALRIRVARDASVRQVQQLEAKVADTLRELNTERERAQQAEQQLKEASHLSQSSAEAQRTSAETANRESQKREEALREKLRLVEKRAEELSAKLTTAEQTLREESSASVVTAAALQRTIATSQQETKSLMEENASLSGRLAAADKQLASLQTDLEASRQEYARTTSILGELRRGATEEIRQRTATIQQLEAEIVRLRVTNTQSLELATHLDLRVHTLQRDLTEAQERLAGNRKHSESEVSTAVEAAEAQRQKYNSELVALTANAQRLEMHCADQVKEIERAAEERVQAVQSENWNLKARVQALEQELLDNTMDAHASQVTTGHLRDQLAALEAQQAQDRNAHEESVKGHHARLENLRRELEFSQRATLDAQQKLREKQAQLDAFESNSADQLIAVKRAHQRELTVAEEKLNASDQRVKMLEASVKRKDERLEQLATENSKAQTRVIELEAAEQFNVKVTADLKATLAQNATLQERINNLREEKEALHEQLRDTIAHNGSVTNDVQRAKMQTEEVERRLAAMKQTVAALESQRDALEGEIRNQQDLVKAANDERKREATAHAMTKTELATALVAQRASEQALRDAEQMNVDLLGRVTEVENSLDDSRLAAQKESFSRTNIDASSIFSWHHVGPRDADLSPSRSVAVSRAAYGDARGGDVMPVHLGGLLELREMELRAQISDFYGMFNAFARRLRAVLDDASHHDRLERQRTLAEQRRVRTLMDHVDALQSEAAAMQEAWRNDADGTLHEASIILMLEECQARRILETAAIQGGVLVARDYLVRPLAFEARKLSAARQEADAERKAAAMAVGRAADAERRLAEAQNALGLCHKESSELRRRMVDDVAAYGKQLDRDTEGWRAAVQSAASTGRVEADEVYCRWTIYDCAIVMLSTIRTMAKVRFPAGTRKTLAADERTVLQRQVALWKTRCHAIVELEKASLDAAIDTAVRGPAPNHPPPPPARITQQTLQHRQPTFVPQAGFDTQHDLLRLAQWC
jgi:chromosome segregation ATPase